MFKWLRNASSKQNKYQFEQVFDENKDYVYRLALSISANPADADDITQEVFVAVYQGLAKFNGNSHIRTWLYRITIRISGKHLSKRQMTHNQADVIELVAPENHAYKEQWQQLLSAMHQLPLMQRTVISLVIIEGLSHQEAAEVLGIPSGTVGSRLHKAKNALINLIEKKRAY